MSNTKEGKMVDAGGIPEALLADEATVEEVDATIERDPGTEVEATASAEAAVIRHNTQVVHPATGEVIDVARLDDFSLATLMYELDDLKSRSESARGDANAEALERLDRGLSWTKRVGDPDGPVQYEMNAPSPDADTTDYTIDVLVDGLRTLVDENVLSAEGADSVVQRAIKVRLIVPIDLDLKELADKITDAGSLLFGKDVELKVDEVRTESKVSANGVARASKVERVLEVVEAARVEKAPAARKVKVKPKTRS